MVYSKWLPHNALQWTRWIWSQWKPSCPTERMLHPSIPLLMDKGGQFHGELSSSPPGRKVPAHTGKFSLPEQAMKGFIHFMWVNTLVPRGHLFTAPSHWIRLICFYISNLCAACARFACYYKTPFSMPPPKWSAPNKCSLRAITP